MFKLPQNCTHLSSVQSLGHVQLFVTPWTITCQASCPSQIPRVYSDSCPLSQWCHPTISSSVIALSSCLQSFPEWGSFQMSHFFTSGGQSIVVSSLASVLPMNSQDRLVGSPCSPRGSQKSFPTPQFKSINSSVPSFLCNNSHIHTWQLEKP